MKNKVLYHEGKTHRQGTTKTSVQVTVTQVDNPDDARDVAYLLFLRAWDDDDHSFRETILLDSGIITEAQAIREGIKFIDQLQIPEDLVLQ